MYTLLCTNNQINFYKICRAILYCARLASQLRAQYLYRGRLEMLILSRPRYSDKSSIQHLYYRPFKGTLCASSSAFSFLISSSASAFGALAFKIFWGTFYEIFCFFQAKARNFSYSLNDRNFLVIWNWSFKSNFEIQ